MVAADILGAKNFLFLANVLNTLRIDKLVVPEVVPMTSPEAILDCQYTSADDRFILQWFINGSELPVYQWRPWNEPQVQGILKNKLDLSYRASNRIMEERRALRIVELSPALSGVYTCVIVADGGAEVRRTATMMVFSPERDFTLHISKNQSTEELVVKCAARGLYPQPELILEHDGVLIRKQVQRVWRNADYLFDTDVTSELSSAEARLVHKLTCRLLLPQAGYIAMKEEQIRTCSDEKVTNGASKLRIFPSTTNLILYFLVSILFHSFLSNLKTA